MAGRFSKRAVRVVHAAVAEAERRRDPMIGTEHLLLGLATEPPRGLDITTTALREALDAMDAHSLTAVGVDVDPAMVAPGPEAPVRWFRRDHRPFTAGAKATLEGALAEARMLRQDRIGPEHLLLSLTARPVGDPAVALLGRMGVEPAALRTVIMESLRATA